MSPTARDGLSESLGWRVRVATLASRRLQLPWTKRASTGPPPSSKAPPVERGLSGRYEYDRLGTLPINVYQPPPWA